jgi:hypothetical protein
MARILFGISIESRFSPLFTESTKNHRMANDPSGQLDPRKLRPIEPLFNSSQRLSHGSTIVNAPTRGLVNLATSDECTARFIVETSLSVYFNIDFNAFHSVSGGSWNQTIPPTTLR